MDAGSAAANATTDVPPVDTDKCGNCYGAGEQGQVAAHFAYHVMSCHHKGGRTAKRPAEYARGGRLGLDSHGWV